jgi:uncharacterized protein YdaU (DUF1376 family)
MSLPRMSWHIGDYKKDTGHLRAAQHGAYFMLCMHYWATGGLPDDDKQLATIACMTDREWKSARPIIEPLFKGEGKWKHKRVDEELTSAQAKYEKRAEAGSKGGNAKAAAKQCSSNATAKPYQPITDNPNQVSEAKASGVPPDFKAELFERGKSVLGPNSGGLIVRLLRSFGSEDDQRAIAKARARIEEASTKANPAEWVGRVLAPKPGEFKLMSNREGII